MGSPPFLEVSSLQWSFERAFSSVLASRTQTHHHSSISMRMLLASPQLGSLVSFSLVFFFMGAGEGSSSASFSSPLKPSKC